MTPTLFTLVVDASDGFIEVAGIPGAAFAPWGQRFGRKSSQGTLIGELVRARAASALQRGILHSLKRVMERARGPAGVREFTGGHSNSPVQSVGTFIGMTKKQRVWARAPALAQPPQVEFASS
jgi:hypothetical protein